MSSSPLSSSADTSSFAPFSERRRRLLAQMRAAGGGIAVLATAQEMPRNSDNSFPFRHDSYFYYLSGFTEPESLLVLQATPDGERSILFCREKNLEMEIWDGYRYGPDAAREALGLDAAYPIGAADQHLPELLADAGTLFYSHGADPRLDAQLQRWLQAVQAKSRSGVTPPALTVDLRSLLDEMRVFKDASEIALMQRAADISAAAHARAMRFTRPGCREYEIEAELLHEFRRSGAQSPSYGPIVAAGANACVLHYQANNALVREGDLVLIDAGCEFDSYAADITRTYPAIGSFSGPQKALYELVLAAQQAALNCARPGSRYMDGHHAAVKVLTQGMLDTGLLDKNKVGSVDDAIASAAFRQFYMHGTGHWLGLDVHDAGRYRETDNAGSEKPYRQLQPGMVLTVEPGIYVRPAAGVPEPYWNIGIRIEDDVLITADGHLNLSHAAPKTVAEIEQWMRG
jgi:Xaa-Pro aminopeptidase